MKEGRKIPFFKGANGSVLLSSERLMSVLVEVEAGEKIPIHSHPHEQMGICLDGEAEFKGEEGSIIIKKGMVYFFRSNEKHSVQVVGKKKGVFLDVFSPPREDYLSRI